MSELACDSAQKVDKMYTMITSLMEGQASRDMQVNHLSLCQTELVTAAQASQSSHNELAMHFQKVSRAWPMSRRSKRG